MQRRALVFAQGMLVVAVLLIPACHQTSAVAPPGAGDNVITSDELESAGSASIYDAIVRRHALFLRDRGATSVVGHSTPRAVVFMGDVEYGVIETMRDLPAERFAMVRYYSGIQATTKFGSQYSGGVIQLVPKYR